MGSGLEQAAVTAEEASSHPTLTGWRVLRHHLRTTLRTGSMPVGANLVARIVAAAEELDHHPDLDLRYASLHVSVTTFSKGTLTAADIALAERITRIADELGVPVDPTAMVELEIGIDAVAREQIRPFWRAVLGYVDNDGELADPHGRLPQVWFQTSTEPRRERGCVHIDVHVPHDEAAARVEAAVAAGGRLVTDAYAPSWWVLADAEGNEACVCSWQESRL